MKREVLLMVLISYAVAQLMIRPIKVLNVESHSDLHAKLKDAGDKLVVIGFLPRACPHSVKITPQYEKLALQYAHFVVFLRVYEDHDDIFVKYDVKSVPTFIFVRKNEPLNKRTSNIADIISVIEAVKAEDQLLNTLNTTQTLDNGGVLYDVECHDDMKGRLAEAKDKLVVLGFLPSYCAHSYMMIPEVQELAKKYAKTTSFLRIKEDHDDIYEIFGIHTVPTFIFLQNKRKLLVRTGASVKQLADTVEGILTGDYTSTTTTTEAPKSHIIDVTSPQDLRQKIAAAGNQLVILAFMTKWCSKCKKIHPKIEAMADEYYGTVTFLKIDDDINTRDLYAEYRIQRVPTFVFIRNSRKINQYEGTMYDKIRSRIELQDFLNF
ncbi:thioredoxin domain-containing protein 5 homolog isoform X1 [Leguminivora glycinivorella]|uniref:thioredoxin domain-containing protein 5 homolog isoform X1 n=1 Tax=Leguminivora glycinivorella TaxID=1035111 RepID=UPI00200EAF50|nr:thioredoxin domain-containing protein 5 homolog isoform X1 [Leguminivora glycinivorella]